MKTSRGWGSMTASERKIEMRRRLNLRKGQHAPKNGSVFGQIQYLLGQVQSEISAGERAISDAEQIIATERDNMNKLRGLQQALSPAVPSVDSYETANTQL